MRLVWSYVERHGRPVSYYTDKAGLFQTAPKTARYATDLPRDEREPLPPTQIGRALRELDIVWIGAHSPQAKGRVERSFQTAQDRLVKGLRVAGAKTLEQANIYLETEFIVWWNNTIAVVPASSDDAHRPLGKEHSLTASLSYLYSKFENDLQTFTWNNGFFNNNVDTTYLAPDNQYQKIAANLTYRGLPWNSTFAARYTWQETKSDATLAQTALNSTGNPAFGPTLPNVSAFATIRRCSWGFRSLR